MRVQTHKRYKKQDKKRKANVTPDMLKNLQQALNDQIKPERKENRNGGKKGKTSGKEKKQSPDRSS